MRETTKRVILGALLAGLAAAGCGAAGTEAAPAGPAERCAAGLERAVGPAGSSWAAALVSPASAYRFPGRSRIAVFGLRNANGVSTVFGVVGERVDARCVARWVHVQLPL